MSSKSTARDHVPADDVAVLLALIKAGLRRLIV